MLGPPSDGHASCFPWLHFHATRAKQCELLLEVTPKNLAAITAEFGPTGIPRSYDGFCVSGITDLRFLKYFPDIRHVEIVDAPRVDIGPLAGLGNMRGLRVESAGSAIDFSCFPHLEAFAGDWRADNHGLAACRELHTLRINNFKPKSNDLIDLAAAVRLENLEITRTDITSLNGVGAMEDLRRLDVALATKLASLDVLAGNGAVRDFALTKAKKVPSYRPLAAMSRLRLLKLTDYAPMPDLKWTVGLDRLHAFTFVDTIVENGDLGPLLKLPSLRMIGTMDKKHYSHKQTEFNALLARRDRDAANPSSSAESEVNAEAARINGRSRASP